MEKQQQRSSTWKLSEADPLCWLFDLIGVKTSKTSDRTVASPIQAKSGDFFVTYEGEQYNIFSFLSKHPGGQKVFIPLQNGDMTKAFDEVGHSKSAKVLMRRYLVKTLSSETTAVAEISNDAPIQTEEQHKAEEYLAKNTFKLPSGDIRFLSKKLFTNEDKYFVHKTFGFLSLLSFIYRYFYVWPVHGNLGMNGTAVDFATLLLHMLLTGSSLIFHVLERRLTRNPLIIYEEYRLHAIIFTMRTTGIALIGFIPLTIMSKLQLQLLLVGWMVFCHFTVDEITRRYGTPGVTAVRNGKDNELRSMKLFFSYYQFLMIGGQLLWNDKISDLGYNALIAIQSSGLSHDTET